jgi:hypothetical protein
LFHKTKAILSGRGYQTKTFLIKVQGARKERGRALCIETEKEIEREREREKKRRRERERERERECGEQLY